MSRVAIQTGSPAIRTALRARLEPPHDIVESDADIVVIDVPTEIAGTTELEGIDAPLAVILVDEPRERFLRRALGAGVRVVLTRDATRAELQASIDAAELGMTVLGSDARLSLRESERAPSDIALTDRESEVLALLASGASNKAIGARLHISDHTVKFHVAAILAKLGASTRAEAVTIGVRNGLLMI